MYISYIYIISFICIRTLTGLFIAAGPCNARKIDLHRSSPLINSFSGQKKLYTCEILAEHQRLQALRLILEGETALLWADRPRNRARHC